MKVYIAAPFFNPEQLTVVESIEAALKEHGLEYFSPREDGIIKDMPSELRKEEMFSEIYYKNVKGIQNCEAMVAVIDDFDTGTVFEMGYAAALWMPIVTVSTQGHGLNVMLSQCVITHTDSADDAARCLAGKPCGEVVKETVE